jgi:hypothetical protein
MNGGSYPMPENFRPQVVMGIIILILALALIVLSFIPKRVQFHQMNPGSGAQMPSSSQQASVMTHVPLITSSLLVIPPLAFTGIDG